MEFRKKTTATLLIALFMISAFAVAAYAPDGTHLVATTGGPGTGTEDRIVINMPAGFTLGMLNSISWDENLVKGYPPHVDVILGNGESLNFEYAYNTVSHYAEGQITGDTAYGALKDLWYATFSDDTFGPAQIDNSAKAWPNSGISGPLGDSNHQLHTLAEWKAGITTIATSKLIDASKTVLRLEIEIDNWIIDTEAYVKNIKVNGGSAVSMSVTSDGYDLTVSIVGLGDVSPLGKDDCYSGEEVELDAIPAANWHFKGWTGGVTSTDDPLSVTMDASKSVTATFELDVLSIGVSPTLVDFGTVIMGEESDPVTMTITNQGNVLLEVNAEVIETVTFFDTYLTIDTDTVDDWSALTFEVAIGSPDTVDLVLDLTTFTTSVDTFTGTLVFWAEAA